MSVVVRLGVCRRAKRLHCNSVVSWGFSDLSIVVSLDPICHAVIISMLCLNWKSLCSPSRWNLIAYDYQNLSEPSQWPRLPKLAFQISMGKPKYFKGHQSSAKTTRCSFAHHLRWHPKGKDCLEVESWLELLEWSHFLTMSKNDSMNLFVGYVIPFDCCCHHHMNANALWLCMIVLVIISK
jgi:hypothetical protein